MEVSPTPDLQIDSPDGLGEATNVLVDSIEGLLEGRTSEETRRLVRQAGAELRRLLVALEARGHEHADAVVQAGVSRRALEPATQPLPARRADGRFRPAGEAA